MSKNIEFSKELKIKLTLDEICEKIENLPMKDRVYIMDNILNCYGIGENPLRSLAEYEHKEAIKASKRFASMSKDPALSHVSDSYEELSENYKREAENWKRFLAE